MGTFLKVFLALLLTLPLGAYIAGTLVASQADMPVERAPVVLERSPSDSGSIPPGSPGPSPSARPTDDSDDRDEDRDDDDDDDVRVVRPTPRDVDDDGDDHGGDDHGGDDREDSRDRDDDS